MNLDGARVLVTGAGGFIGSHLCERLVAVGAHVKAFVRYTSRNDPGMLRYAPVLPKIEILAGDLRDPEAVRGAVSGADVVFHLGALIGIPYSFLNPREVIEVNVLGTLNVLQAARELEVGRVVHTSTSEVYGTAQTARIAEEHPLRAQSPYTASKIAADKVVESYHLSFGLPAVTIRPFNTYGPRQSARAVIPTIVSQALQGNRVRLGALDTVRDFTFVDDTIEGMILGASTGGVEGEVFNLGVDGEVSIRELVSRVGALLDRELVPEVDPERVRPQASEVLRLRSDNSKALDTLGWRPKVDLDEGLRRVVDWVKSNPELYRESRYQV